MGVITTLADRASEAEAGIGEGGEWIAGAAGSGSRLLWSMVWLSTM
jgi:hypothetical protein